MFAITCIYIWEINVKLMNTSLNSKDLFYLIVHSIFILSPGQPIICFMSLGINVYFLKFH